MHRFCLSVILSSVGMLTGFEVSAQTPAAATATQAPTSDLAAYVIAGSNAVNVLKPPSVVPPTISVRYGNRPATGAIVTFSAPRSEPTVKFPNGATSYSVVTDVNGQATVEDMVPLGLGGFDIQVYVTYLDEYGSATIRETNYPTLKAASESGTLPRGNRVQVPMDHGLSTAAKVGIISGIAIAAGLGAYFALHAHAATSTVAAGTPSVGAP